MKLVSSLAIAVGAMAITSSVVAVPLLTDSKASQKQIPRVDSTDSAGAPTSPASPSSSPIKDQACQLGAVPDLSGLDSRVVDSAAVTGFAQPPRVGRAPLSKDAAVEFARTRSNSPALDSAPAVAVSVPYSTAGRWFADQNQLIAPSRCVWVVTVNAPFTPSRVLRGVKAIELDVYSLILDQASGQYVGLMAGPEAPNMITGVVPLN